MFRIRRSVVALVFALSITALPSRADVFDVADGDVAALVAAIQAANNNSVADTINLASNGLYSLTTVADAGTGPTGLPGVRSLITINGNGSVIERGEGAPANLRIFRIQTSGKLFLNNLEVRNGVATSNSTGSLGGGAYLAGGTLTLTNCTFADNHAVVGGAIYQVNGTLTLLNSTISGNTATQAGGIFSDGMLNLTSVTLTNNSATDRCGGLDASGVASNKAVSVANSILAGNSAPTSPDVDLVGSVSSAGHNLVGDAGTTDGWNADDMLGDANAPIDPMLGPLQLNDGLTSTHELMPGSPAVDAIQAEENGCGTTLVTDQCGSARPVGGGCDIGSFELQLTAPEAHCQNVSVDAGGDCMGAVTPQMVDNGSSVDPNCGPAQLSLDPAGPYAVGDTVVTLTVTDSCGQSASCTATITVTAVAAATCPEDMTLRPTMPSGAAVNFDLENGDDCGGGSPPAGCSVASGDVLPIGSTTEVQCTSAGGQTCTFTVHVQTLPEAVCSLIDGVHGLEDDGVLRHQRAKLLIAKLKSAKHKFKKGKLEAGCGKLTAFGNKLNALVKAGLLSEELAQPLLTAAAEIQNAACGSDPDPDDGDGDGDNGGDEGGEGEDGDSGSGGDDEDGNSSENENGEKGPALPEEIDVKCGAQGATVILMPLAMLAIGHARRPRRS